VVVDNGPKNTTNKDALRSERRSALKKRLTEPTLLEMSGNRVTQDLGIIWFRQCPEFFRVGGNIGKKQVCEVVGISKEFLV
jgi:hypothetical protein